MVREMPDWRDAPKPIRDFAAEVFGKKPAKKKPKGTRRMAQSTDFIGLGDHSYSFTSFTSQMMSYARCELCNRKVEKINIYHEDFEDTIALVARCHGRVETKRIARSTFERANLQPSDLIRQNMHFFKSDADMLGGPATVEIPQKQLSGVVVTQEECESSQTNNLRQQAIERHCKAVADIVDRSILEALMVETSAKPTTLRKADLIKTKKVKKQSDIDEAEVKERLKRDIDI